MKKFVCVVLAMFMVFGLAACSTAGETASTSVSTAPSESASAEVSETTSASAEATQAVDFPEMNLKLTIANPENSVQGEGMKLFKSLVSDATNGKVIIEPYFNCSLVAQNEQIPSVMKGTVDFAAGSLADYVDWEAMTVSAYFFKNKEHRDAFFSSDIAKQLFDDAANEFGIRWLGAYSEGLRTVNLREDKKVTCRADLEGIKIRMPGTEICQVNGSALGANPVPISSADLYVALQTGTVDGEDNPVANIISNSWYEVTKSVTMTGHQISGVSLYTNEALFQGMSPELQQIIMDAAEQACEYISETSFTKQAEDMEFLRGKGLSVYELSDDELTTYSNEVKAYVLTTDLAKSWDMDLYNAIQDLAK